MATALIVCPWLEAVTIVSGPSLTPTARAPLAAVLQLSTDIDSRVSVLVSDGTNMWERDFYDFATTHSVPLFGFKPGRTNQVLVTIYDKARNAATAPQLLTFITASLPSDFPQSKVLKSEPSSMEPGYTLFMIENNTAGTEYVTIMDNSGEVVWYCPWTLNDLDDIDVRQLSDGDLFIEEEAPLNRFLEVNLLGETVHIWSAPSEYPVNFHDGVPTDHGTILYLSHASRTVANFPSSVTNSNAPLETVTVDDNPVVEISATNSALLHAWSPLDLLDPTRVSYLTYEFNYGYGVDNEHANAVIENTNDNSIVVSLRNQNAVFELSRSTGQLNWILGPHANWGTNWEQYLLTPVGTPFRWNYGQHAPHVTPQGTFLLYDDGNEQASPFDPPLPDQDNYSRAVEYSINETNMEVSQVWDTSPANQDRLFTPVVGKAEWLPQRRNVLVTYGNITYVNGVPPSSNSPEATMVRLVEYTHDPVPEVVFDLSFFDSGNTSTNYYGYFCYRSSRICDLYPHPAQAVSDLAASRANSTVRLEFSADPTHAYLIQASTDLANWITVGAPLQEGGAGDFYFDDLEADEFAARFYRVVTQ